MEDMELQAPSPLPTLPAILLAQLRMSLLVHTELAPTDQAFLDQESEFLDLFLDQELDKAEPVLPMVLPQPPTTLQEIPELLMDKAQPLHSEPHPV